MSTGTNTVSPVRLAGHSLYVATSQITPLGPPVGRFHWALYGTDANGAAAKAHWTTLKPGTGFVEGVRYQNVPSPSTFSSTGSTTYFFVKINGFAARGSFDDFRAMLSEVFDPPNGYPTLYENRRHSITCRTWILKVVQRLVGAGWITRPGGAPPMADMERFITNLSIAMEDRCAQSLFAKAHVTEY